MTQNASNAYDASKHTITLNFTNKRIYWLFITVDLTLIKEWEGQALIINTSDNKFNFILTSNTSKDHYEMKIGDEMELIRVERLYFAFSENIPDIIELQVSVTDNKEFIIGQINSSLFQKCPPYTDFVSNTCKCRLGYYQIEGTSDCMSGAFDSSICVSCYPCPEFCKACNNNGVCNTCETGFNNSANGCIPINYPSKIYNLK